MLHPKPLSEAREKHRRKAKLVKYNMRMKSVNAITTNQKEAFVEFFRNGSNVILHGVAGTGKTYLSMYFALSELLAGNVDQIIIIRSAVQGREIGHMPGTEAEKLSYYEAPYKAICSELMDSPRAYETIKERNGIQFASTAFLRGSTFDNAIIIVDEIQNMNDQELSTIMTRVGTDSRVIACGDFRQDDLKNVGRKHDKSGVHMFLEIAREMPSVALIEFGIEDIVRSGFVKEYLMARINLGFP